MVKKRDDNLVRILIIVGIILIISVIALNLPKQTTGKLIGTSSEQLPENTYKILQEKQVQVHSNKIDYTITLVKVINSTTVDIIIENEYGFYFEVEQALGDTAYYNEEIKIQIKKIIYSGNKNTISPPKQTKNYVILEIKPLAKMVYANLDNCDNVFTIESGGTYTTDLDNDPFPKGQSAGIIFNGCAGNGIPGGNRIPITTFAILCNSSAEKSLLVVIAGHEGGYICYNPSTKKISTPSEVISRCCSERIVSVEAIFDNFNDFSEESGFENNKILKESKTNITFNPLLGKNPKINLKF